MKFLLSFLLVLCFNAESLNNRLIMKEKKDEGLPSGKCLSILVTDATLIYAVVKDVLAKNYGDIISKLPGLLTGLYHAYQECFSSSLVTFYFKISQDDKYTCVISTLKKIFYNIIYLIKDTLAGNLENAKQVAKVIDEEFLNMRQCI